MTVYERLTNTVHTFRKRMNRQPKIIEMGFSSFETIKSVVSYHSPTPTSFVWNNTLVKVNKGIPPEAIVIIE